MLKRQKNKHFANKFENQNAAEKRQFGKYTKQLSNMLVRVGGGGGGGLDMN